MIHSNLNTMSVFIRFIDNIKNLDTIVSYLDEKQIRYSVVYTLWTYMFDNEKIQLPRSKRIDLYINAILNDRRAAGGPVLSTSGMRSISLRDEIFNHAHIVLYDLDDDHEVTKKFSKLKLADTSCGKVAHTNMKIKIKPKDITNVDPHDPLGCRERRIFLNYISAMKTTYQKNNKHWPEPFVGYKNNHIFIGSELTDIFLKNIGEDADISEIHLRDVDNR